MKTFKAIIVASAAITFASFVSAQTEVPNTFEAGATATAASVNANFTALINAIDALGDRVGALETSGTAVSNDVNGRSYAVVEFARQIEAQDNGSGTNFLDNLYGNEITITFDGATTAVFNYTNEESELLHTQNIVPADGEIDSYIVQTDTSYSRFTPEVVVGYQTTYTQSGNIVSLDVSDEGDGSEILDLTVSPDGGTMVAISIFGSTTESEISIMIGVEITD